MPGGPKTPPPCKRCGSTGDFYASGLCSRCHHFAPQRIESCRDCFAWGATRTLKWRCSSCNTWNDTYTARDCAACHRSVVVNAAGFCRLCTRQWHRERLDNHEIDVVDANREGQQLWLADMHKKARLRTRPRLATAGQSVPQIRPVSHRQLVLFAMPRDIRAGRGVVPETRTPQLLAALERVVREVAAERAWTGVYRSDVTAGIRIVLALQDTPGAPVSADDVGVIRQLRLPVRSVHEVLDSVGMLDHDRVPTIDLFFARHTDGLPAGIVDELAEWFDVMRNGSGRSPRRLPRSETTIRIYLAAASPAIRRWADTGTTSLREVTRDDVVAALAGDRTKALQALRSIFTILKARKRVFTNPTTRIPSVEHQGHQPVPLAVDVIREALNSQDPARAAVAALVAFHGLGSAELRALRCTDIRDGRIHLADRSAVLAEPVRQRITSWVTHRNLTWPETTNPHLFIHFRTAKRSDAVGARWVKLTLGIPGNVRAVRQDRILHEAHATGGDTRRLCDLFGLSIQAATRYTNTVDHPDLLEL